MTLELKEALDAEMDEAMASKDQDRINVAQLHYNKAMCDCQYKSAERIKEIASSIPKMQSDITAIKNIVEKGKNAMWQVAKGAFKWIVATGGVIEFVRYLVTGSL